MADLKEQLVNTYGHLPEMAQTLFYIQSLKFKLATLGITKLHSNSERIQITFSPQTPVEPIQIIQLIQTQPKIFKMHGQDKLSYLQKMTDLNQKRQAIEQLLKELQ